tara:strand:- start:63 stop:413 length:351 start_codon:yes stop_codon:yes gene_type:complete
VGVQDRFIETIITEIAIGQGMYYRITRATVRPGMYDEAMATMESLRDSIGNINGLITSRLIRISETELVGVAAYESKEHLEASQIEFTELMSNMAPYMAAPPSISYGEQVLSFNGE